MNNQEIAAATPEELGKQWRRLCNRHDYLIDNADMGDERIYFAQQEMTAIEREFTSRGLRYFDYTRDEEDDG